jgi:hypothetical protein
MAGGQTPLPPQCVVRVHVSIAAGARRTPARIETHALLSCPGSFGPVESRDLYLTCSPAQEAPEAKGNSVPRSLLIPQLGKGQRQVARPGKHLMVPPQRFGWKGTNSDPRHWIMESPARDSHTTDLPGVACPSFHPPTMPH